MMNWLCPGCNYNEGEFILKGDSIVECPRCGNFYSVGYDNKLSLLKGELCKR